MYCTILPGLPGTGEPAINCSFDGTGVHSEGLVVDFGGKWCGNFVRGKTRHDALYSQFTPDYVHVVSGGHHYIVDVAAKFVVPATRDWVGASIFSFSAGVVIVFDLTTATAYKGRSRIWESDRIAWDFIGSVIEVGSEIHGEAYGPHDESIVRFKLDPLTGKHIGGGYPS